MRRLKSVKARASSLLGTKTWEKVYARTGVGSRCGVSDRVGARVGVASSAVAMEIFYLVQKDIS